MIAARLYLAPLPAHGAVLAAPPSVVRDLARLGRLLAAHPTTLRIDVLAPDTTAIADRDAVLSLVRRAACAASFAIPTVDAQPRFNLPPLRGAWYAALVAWGWLTLLAAGQTVANVLGGLWLAVGLPWVRHATRNRDVDAAASGAEWTAAALDGAEVRVLAHAGLAQVAAAVAGSGEPTGTVASGGTPVESESEALLRAAAACASAGVSELAPIYSGLAHGELADAVWTHVAPAAG